MSWTEDRVQLLKKLWGEGQSASQIAKELGGVTRNAVIGKVHRLGLSNRASSGEASRPVAAKAALKAPESKEQAAQAEQTQKAASLKVVAETPVPTRKPILPAGKPLPPQPSANEISPEALATQREVRERALRLSLMELTEKTCKWPFGDPATDDFWFCGLPVEPGTPYCKPCKDVAFQPASARRDRKR